MTKKPRQPKLTQEQETSLLKIIKTHGNAKNKMKVIPEHFANLYPQLQFNYAQLKYKVDLILKKVCTISNYLNFPKSKPIFFLKTIFVGKKHT